VKDGLLSFFTVPKPFLGNVGTAQTNAVRSWSRLDVAGEILLFGDEPGTAEAARRLGVTHSPALARNQLGTPLVDDLFTRVRSLASYDTLCFINADMILLSDFSAAVAALPSRPKGFLMVGRRTNLNVVGEITPGLAWERRLREDAAARGELGPPVCIDYFVFPRDLFGAIPAFAIGRASYDNWLLCEARKRGALLVDASHDVLAVHQNHDYAHVPGRPGSWEGPESDRNRELAGGWEYLFTIEDATHCLVDGRVRRARHRALLRRRLAVQRLVHPRWAPLFRLLLAAVDRTYPLRARLGLAVNPPGSQGRRSDR
jgi:hypothetical protein